MADWLIWLLVAAGFAAGELMTLGFFLGPIAIAASAAALVAAVGGGAVIQAITFIVLPALWLSRVRDRLSHAERRLFLHAWHLERLATIEGDAR